jgi:hypothetical protein
MMDERSQRQLAELAQRAWTKKAFRQKLLSDPRLTFEEFGITLAEGVEVNVVVEQNVVAFRIQPTVSGDAMPTGWRNTMILRFEFEWVWD